MGKKRQWKEAIAAGGLDPEDAAKLAEDDEFAKELAAARDIMREQGLLGGGGDEEDSDDDDDAGVGPGGAKKVKPREFINNQGGLRQALEEIQAANGARPWPETMDVCAFPLDLADVHDDIQRETAFYQVAMGAVQEGRKRLLAHKVPYQRPADFFCDMLKSDEHMAKVKDRLLFEQKKIAAVEERRKAQENRKFSKALKSHKAKEKSDDRKRTLDAVKEWQKQSKAKRGGQSLLPDRDDGLEDILEGRGGGAGGQRQQQRGGKPQPNKKRQSKDRKYGFGGPKRKLKQATAKSLNDFSGFNPKKGKTFGGGAKKGGGGKNRPGKAARQKARAQRR